MVKLFKVSNTSDFIKLYLTLLSISSRRFLFKTVDFDFLGTKLAENSPYLRLKTARR